MERRRYTRPHVLTALHEQLNAALLFPVAVEDGEDAGTLYLTFPDDTDWAAVQAVVDKHDRAVALAVLAAKRQAEQDDYDTIEQRLADLADAATVLAGTPTAAQQKAALITVGRACALALRTLRRQLGAARAAGQ